jgi:hypothetical protein
MAPLAGLASFHCDRARPVHHRRGAAWLYRSGALRGVPGRGDRNRPCDGLYRFPVGARDRRGGRLRRYFRGAVAFGKLQLRGYSPRPARPCGQHRHQCDDCAGIPAADPSDVGFSARRYRGLGLQAGDRRHDRLGDHLFPRHPDRTAR